jgi:hypothetical protein
VSASLRRRDRFRRRAIVRPRPTRAIALMHRLGKPARSRGRRKDRQARAVVAPRRAASSPSSMRRRAGAHVSLATRTSVPRRGNPTAPNRPKGQSPGRPPDARIHATAQPGTALSRRRWTVAFGVAPRADRAGAVRGEDGPAARAHAAARKLEGVVSRTERGPGPSSTPDSFVVSCRSERSACWVRAVQGSWAGGLEFTRRGR